jgi:hypothetical protein
MPEIMKPRRLTVSYTYPPLRTTRMPYTEEPPPIPALRLRGHWLAQAGFGIGAHIEVIVMAGELVLKVLPPESGAPAVKRAAYAEVGSGDMLRGAYL